jgi:predicted transcriptional regulator
VKTLAIRLDDDVANQLAVVAHLEGTSLVELIRQAVAELLTAKRSNQELGERAADILAEIDQDAADRKAAIAALFGNQPQPEARNEPRPAKGRQRPTGNGGTEG